MKALTLTQPWATLVAIGAKRIETRSWKTPYRGELAIHAAKGLGKLSKWRFISMLDEEPFKSVLKAHFGEYRAPYFPHPMLNNLPGGAIVATCTILDCFAITTSFADNAISSQERAFGDYTPGRYAWLLANVQKLETPIPAKGALGLWEWTPPPGFTI